MPAASTIASWSVPVPDEQGYGYPYEAGGSYPLPDLTGASRSFRNNNPGNLIDSPWSRAHGAIGRDAQGFAIFPNVDVGHAAQAALWTLPRYADRPLGQAVQGWGGLYGKQLGIDPSQTFSQLTPEQQQQVLNRQQQMEGYIPPRSGAGPASYAAVPQAPPDVSLEPVAGDPFAGAS